MAKPQQNPADLAKQASKLGELKARFLFLIGAVSYTHLRAHET